MDRTKSSIKIYIVTVTFQLSIILLTFIDFFTSSNDANVLREFFRLLASRVTRLANCLCKCYIFKTSTNRTDRQVEPDTPDDVKLEDIYRQLRQDDDIQVMCDVNDTKKYNPSILGVFQPLQPPEDT